MGTMVRKRKDRDGKKQAKAKRTQLLMPREVPPKESDEETIAIQEFPFTLDHYSVDCFVNVVLMIGEEASVARGTFKDARGKEVLVHVPT